MKELRRDSNEGVFFWKNIPDTLTRRAIWTLREYLRYIHTPSQINRRAGSNHQLRLGIHAHIPADRGIATSLL